MHPGSTDTDMNSADAEHATVQRNLVAIARFDEPRDITGLVAWLASKEGRFAIATDLTIDGGAKA